MIRDQDWIDLELQNWARWVIDRPSVGHCASIEHRYCAGYWGGDEGVPRGPLIPTDALRALACERAIVRLPKAPQPYAYIIKSHYLRRGSLDRRTIIVHVGLVRYRMASNTYFLALKRAKLMVENLLTRGSKHAEMAHAGRNTEQNVIEARD